MNNVLLSERSHSNFKTIKHGVPQGSILGPLLFLIYINDLHKAIKNSKTFHFADDTGLLCCDKSLKKLNRMVNHDLAELTKWLRANEISLNTKKTEIVIFRRKGKQISRKLNFRISGQKLKFSRHVKYLGVLIDEHLLWDDQIKELSGKLSKAAGILAKMRHFVNYKSLLNLYYALFEAHLNYCLPVLGYIKREHIHRLTMIQNKALKYIHFKTQRDSPTPLFLQSKILPINALVSLRHCILALDIMQNRAPKYFVNFVVKLGNNHLHGTRSTKLAYVLSNTVTYGSNNLKNSIARSWNFVIPKVAHFNSDSISKNSLKNHIKAQALFDLV